MRDRAGIWVVVVLFAAIAIGGGVAFFIGMHVNRFILSGEFRELVPSPFGTFGPLLRGIVFASLALGVVSAYAAIAVYAERKISAFIQCRMGPMEVGPNFAVGGLLPKGWYGVGTMIGDGIKLLSKEDIIPEQADKSLFRLAPYVVFAAMLASFAVIPMGPGLAPARFDGAVLFLLAASSIGVLGLVMAGYASNNKWSLYGAMRSVAQVISYEIPMGVALLSVCMAAGSLDLVHIATAQSGGFFRWHAFQNPGLFIAAIAYGIAALAETNRAPFDIPEAESELVAGYHTEYSGMRFALFFFAEYANMLLVSIVGSLFFFGGYFIGIPQIDALWAGRAPWLGPVILLTKALFCVFVMIWLRWTLPRYRVDKLMTLCWKGLLPLTLVAFLVTGIAVFMAASQPLQPYGWMTSVLWRVLILVMLAGFVISVRQGLRPMPKRAGGGSHVHSR